MNDELTTIVVKIIFAILSTAITFYLIPLKLLTKTATLLIWKLLEIQLLFW